MREWTSSARRQVVPLGRGVFRLLGAPDDDAEDELWEFPPGSAVVCTLERQDEGDVLIARRLASAGALARTGPAAG